MRIFKRSFKSGNKWGIDYTIGGKRKRVIVGDTRKEAQDFLEQVIKDKHRIKVGLPPENNGRLIPKTLNEALTVYFEERVPSFRSADVIKTTLGEKSAFRKKFGEYALDEISRNDMQNFRDSLLKRDMAYGSVKRIMTCIQSFFTWCKNNKPPWIEEENPASKLFKNCTTTTRNPGWQKQILTIDQVNQIIDLAREKNPERGDLFEWLFCSMQRPSEAKKIEFKDFYKDRGKWYLRIAETKRAGKVKILDVDGPLESILMRQLERREGERFMWNQSLFKNPHCPWLKRYYKQIAGEELRKGNGDYIFKHSAVSYHLNVLATPPQIVSDISGVSVAVLFTWYTKSTEGQRRAALRNLDWHNLGTRQGKKITPSLQSPANSALESYPT